MKLFYYFCLFIFSIAISPAQGIAQTELSGRWEGFVIQKSGQDTFRYVVDWKKTGQSLSGVAKSTSLDGQTTASFEIAGRWTTAKINIQEVRQLSPISPQWCMKTIEMEEVLGGAYSFEGQWTAQGCRPGFVYLKAVLSNKQAFVDRSLSGHWVGQLLQSDRDYGFYFSMDLFADGTGQSYIVSEGAGGEAKHSLRWSILNDQVHIEEDKVIERSEADWPWCIKTLDVSWQKGKLKDHLDGNWEGYIEFKDPATAHCASGRLALEKIHPLPEKVSLRDSLIGQYEGNQGRKVKIDRLIELASPNIRMRVWDNGTVDGDRVTLFLNGERILHNFRVSKRKWGQTVTLHKGENMLILHAEDLGSILPNTVAVSLDDGEREQIIILNSNLRESGGIIMQPFKYKE